jgi:hypothetical protein
MEDVKIRLSALWAAAMLNGLMGGMLELFEPGLIEQVIAGEIGGMQITSEMLLFMAILMVIPPIMVFLSVTLKDKANRWTNIILGIVFFGFGLLELAEKITQPYFLVSGILGIVFAVLIVWYAWKWK